MKAAGETALSSEEQQPASAGNGQRPSLGGTPGSKGDRLSILASVEGHARHGAGPVKPRRRSWLVGVALAAAIVGFFAWRMPPGAVAPAVAERGLQAGPPPSTTAITVATAGDASGLPSPAETAPALAVHEPARIETVVASETVVVTADGHPFVKLNDAAAPRQSVGTSTAARAAAPLPAPATAPTAERVAVAKPAGGGPKKRATPPRERTAKRSPSTSGDADVDLLAALMVHVSGHEATAARPAVSTRVARSAPTIAELVRNCNAMTAAAAQHCRQRICDGYWGKAEACPVDARPAR